MSTVTPTLDSVHRNADKALPETVSSSQESKNSSSVAETLALPVLERHEEAAGEGELSAADDADGSVAADGDSGPASTGDEVGLTAKSSVNDDDDDREMPLLTLYA